MYVDNTIEKTLTTDLSFTAAEHMPYWEQPAIVLFLRHMAQESFDYIWNWETDVRCNGHYADCLADTATMPQDLLCALPPYSNAEWKDWARWHQLAGRLGETPREHRHGCFMPFFRLSRRALELVDAELQVSTGYLEIFFPTLMIQHNLTLGAVPTYDIGIVRYEDLRYLKLTKEFVENFARKPDGRFYHPVKDWL